MRWLPGRVGALVAQGRTQCDANANANCEADANTQGQVTKSNAETGASGQANCCAPRYANAKVVFADLALLFIHSASP